MMGLVMTRNKVSRDEWLLEAMIVALELLAVYQSQQAPGSVSFITRSDGMRCAVRQAVSQSVRELRGLSEVRISEEKPPPSSRDSSRDSSCPPATNAGWRSRLVREEQEELQERRRKKEMEEEERRKAGGHQERKVIRVRRTSERRKRLDTINSESDYSVGSPALSVYSGENNCNSQSVIRNLIFYQISETSDKSARRKKKEKRRIMSSNSSPPGLPPPKKSVIVTSSAPGLK